MKRPLLLSQALALAFAPASVSAQQSLGPTVEYVAHATIIVESASGTRVLIDPFNGEMWMGYRFPEGLEVDAVLVTHPHYDHDASWYFDAGIPVFRQPGVYELGDVRLVGVEGEHSGAARFRARGAEPHNTIWVIEADGVRLAHLGDNRPPTAADLEGIGGADVWFVTPFSPAADVRAVAEAAGVRVVIPVHHRLPDLAAPGYGLPSAQDWLSALDRGVRHKEYRVTYPPLDLSSALEFHVLAAHPDVSSWTPELLEAWSLDSRARALSQGGDPGLAIGLLAEAVELAPTVINFHLALAETLVAVDRLADAREVLARGLAEAPRSDVERTLRARGLLARLLAEAGLDAQAEVLYRLVVQERRTYAADVLAEALAFLAGR